MRSNTHTNTGDSAQRWCVAVRRIKLKLNRLLGTGVTYVYGDGDDNADGYCNTIWYGNVMHLYALHLM